MATRDMTAAQFDRACREEGLQLQALWLVDERLGGRLMYGLVFKGKGKLLRRQSLAHALQQRKREMRSRS